MRAAVQLLAVMFALLIWTGCGDDPQADKSGVVDLYCESNESQATICSQAEISAVLDRHCAYRLDCNWEDDFEVCRQSAISSTAALTHVYGPECGEAWLDLMDCESSLACDDYLGCQAENQSLNVLCF
jgi:hypothetical protein